LETTLKNAFKYRQATRALEEKHYYEIEEKNKKLKQAYETEKELKQLLSQQSAREAAGLVAASVAHNIGNSNNIVRQNIAEAKNKIGRNPTGRKVLPYLNSALQGTDDIGELCNEMRTYGATVSSEKEYLNINNLVADVVKSMSVDLRDYEVDVDIGEDLQVYGNNTNLKTAYVNLVYNAIEALSGQDKKQIDISSEKLGDGRIKITVRDNGEGVEEDQLSQVFTPSFTTKKDGQGLGLKTCYDIMNDHKGEIYAKSEKGKFFEISMIFPNPDRYDQGN